MNWEGGGGGRGGEPPCISSHGQRGRHVGLPQANERAVVWRHAPLATAGGCRRVRWCGRVAAGRCCVGVGLWACVFLLIAPLVACRGGPVTRVDAHHCHGRTRCAVCRTHRAPHVQWAASQPHGHHPARPPLSSTWYQPTPQGPEQSTGEGGGAQRGTNEKVEGESTERQCSCHSGALGRACI